MSELFDKLVDSAGQVISEVDKGGQIQSAISGLRGRLAEAERKRKVNQIKQQIRDLRSREAQAINALSAQILALYEAGSLTQPELVSLCKGVDEVRAQITEKEAELEQLQPPQPEPKTEARCPNCQAAVVSVPSVARRCLRAR
jgi:chromosome segregation ATPase